MTPNAIWSLFRALTGLESGRDCRSCKQTIDVHDAFGLSEGVCVPCRRA